MSLFFIYFVFLNIFLINFIEAKQPVLQVQKNEIVFGQSASLSGHLGIYGQTIKNAINAYFSFINSKGGVNGKKFKLISLDDNGDPKKSLENIRTLKSQGIDMFIGCTGTRSMFSVLPLIKAGEISMFFPWGGHKEFRNSNLKYIINGLGYLEPQLKTIVYEVINVQKLPRVAIFHADDDFSTEAAQIITDVFKKQNVTPIGIVSYNRFTVDIKRASQKLIDLDPKIIISLGTSTPTVRLINNFFEKGYYDTKFIGIDSTLFVNRILKSRGINYTFTSSVPDPIESELSIVKEYRQNINNFCPDETYNILSLAYYVSAAIVVQAIKNCVGTITKEKIISNIEKMQDESIGGYKVTFNLSNRHAFGSNILLVRG